MAAVGSSRSARAPQKREARRWRRLARARRRLLRVRRAPPTEAPTETPSLMDVLAASETRVAERLAETSGEEPLDAEEAERRLRLLFWAEMRAEEIRDLRERNRIERLRQRDTVRRRSARGWLRVGHGASRLALAVAVITVAILTLVGLWLSGHLNPSEVLRLLPGA